MDERIGKEIDGFKILSVLGRGGMGVVYLAEDLALSRKVALKMIDPHLAGDETFLRRFRAEARALARIDSPYIVRVHALRQTDVGLFIVMEYVAGGTIADRIADGPMPWPRALPLIKQMLHALDHAHGVGVVHRDIKPGNIMLSPEGVVKVTDFGLAKLHQQNVEATVTQGIAGTLNYMPPEQVKGQQDLDHRADIYSLGMTIYEMLAGQVPLDKGEGEYALLKKIVEETLPPPSRFVRDLPDGLVGIVMKSLRKEPNDRHQTAGEMLEEITSFEAAQRVRADAAVDGNSLPAAQPDSSIKAPSAREAEGSSRSRRTVLFGALAMGLLLIAFAGWLIYRSEVSSTSTSLLSVITMPDGVAVYIGDRLVGETPLEDQTVDPGSIPVRLEKEGFLTKDTTLTVVRGRRLMLSIRLEEATALATATGTVTSNPDDAAVWIDGEEIGRTPLTVNDLRSGAHMVALQKEGYEEWVWEGVLSPGEEFALSADLAPIARHDREESSGDVSRPADTGLLIVRAEGQGRIAVDGRAVQPGEPVVIETGAHRVSCGEAPEQSSTTVRIDRGQTHELTCYFMSTINVVASTADGTSPFASIWVNGENHGLAPTALTLAPGTYRISVQRDGFEVLDDEKTITLRPGFEPQVYPLAFRIRQE